MNLVKKVSLFSFLALLLVISTSLPSFAGDDKKSEAQAKCNPDEFSKKIDTRLSMEFQKIKTDDKKLSKENKSLAVYKILDVQKTAGQFEPMPGDLVEVVFAEGDKKSDKCLPWAEVQKDGAILMHIPKEFIRRRAKTSAETIWRIDNNDNCFALVKPEGK
ncbi:MAG: hypothetical protein K8F91_26710 [Candidatus Obscuribacterales bacterium]|nr:hypothetical protein [Candidatus Obscuribacterales bacterium]